MHQLPVYPLRFEPVYQYRLWGGRGLANLLSTSLPDDVYSAGVMVLSKQHPQKILYRSVHPVLTPQSQQERRCSVADVVFPTGIDRRDDLGSANCFDVYFGMADCRIGVAHLQVPEHLPLGAAADRPEDLCTRSGQMTAEGGYSTVGRRPKFTKF